MDAAPLLLSTGWAAGVNAYMTALLLGVFGRLGLGDVPDTATASLTEDFLVGVVVALALTHPWLALTVAGTLLLVGIVLLAILWRQLRAALVRRQARQAGSAGWSARSS
jgi:hypothetical protein